MKKMNKLAAVAAALTLSAGIAMTVPAFAATGPGVSTGKTATGNTASTETYSSAPDYTLYNDKYYTYDEVYTKPRLLEPNTWVWLNGYCYYTTGNWQNGYFFKNGTTPDGYTVDADGRWTVNGVVQVDPTYGNKTVWAGYTGGYSNDEIWNYYKTALLKPIADSYDNDVRKIQERVASKKGFTASDAMIGNARDNAIGRNTLPNPKDFMVFDLHNLEWTTDAKYATFTDLKELEMVDSYEYFLKAMLGDHEGGRIFNYIRTLIKIDTSRSSAPYDMYYIHSSDFNYNVYGEGTTDYGRKYTVINTGAAVQIAVY